MTQFPIRRMRRLRRTPALRRLVQETHLVPSQLVWPLFVVHGEGVRREIAALPGVYHTSVDELAKDAERAQQLGLGGVILFGIPQAKDATGSEANDAHGIVQRAAPPPQPAVPPLLGIGGVCLCEDTKPGHCAVGRGGEAEKAPSRYRAAQLAAYQVSGEYAMIKAAAQRNMLDECRAMWETLHAIRRAGADIILSYFAPTAAELL